MKRIIALMLSLIFCVALASCGVTEAPADIWETALHTSDSEFGSGEKTILLEVNAEEKSVTFTVHTDKEILGDALMEHQLIAGEKGAYGIYIKSVNGMVADYDKTQTYWELCKDGESLSTGADGVEIADGDKYEFVYKK